MENLPPAAIRKANAKDIDDIMEIERLSFHPEVIESKKVFEDRIKAFSDGFLIAEIEENGEKIIAGYISSELWKYSEEIPHANFNLNHSVYETHSDSGEELYISSVAVNPAVRGGKIGKRLFTELLSRVSKKHKLKSAILLVNSDWQNAYKMYQKEGFVTIDKISDFFPRLENSDSGDDPSGVGIIMRKSL
ncbi:MAG: GNAT family N-acetyltransferase [Methanosarcinales archaeon]|jgi:ribosomal-protein-alanine N-acetyltransferase|nr:GNAT family N-acetyltransferase [Methanosarcinales archaeon]